MLLTNIKICDLMKFWMWPIDTVHRSYILPYRHWYVRMQNSGSIGTFDLKSCSVIIYNKNFKIRDSLYILVVSWNSECNPVIPSTVFIYYSTGNDKCISKNGGSTGTFDIVSQ